MKKQKKKNSAKPDRLSYTCVLAVLAVALVLGLAHKTGWIEISSKKPVAKVVSAARRPGRSYYRSDVDRKKRADDSTSRWKMSGCESLCWSVEEWYKSVIELLKAQELVRNNGDESSLQDINSENALLQNLEKEWDEVRTNMRLRRHDGGHCLVYFGDKVEYCRDVVSGNISLYKDLEAAVQPIYRRYLHMAKEYEKDANQCLEGSMPRDTDKAY